MVQAAHRPLGKLFNVLKLAKGKPGRVSPWPRYGRDGQHCKCRLSRIPGRRRGLKWGRNMLKRNAFLWMVTAANVSCAYNSRRAAPLGEGNIGRGG